MWILLLGENKMFIQVMWILLLGENKTFIHVMWILLLGENTMFIQVMYILLLGENKTSSRSCGYFYWVETKVHPGHVDTSTG